MPVPSCATSPTVRSGCSSPPVTPAATRRSTRSRSTASTCSLKWDLHDLHRLEMFDHADDEACPRLEEHPCHRHGGEHPYMDKWWVPGLQIGYEHSFVHQVADFLRASRRENPAVRHSATPSRPRRSATPSWPVPLTVRGTPSADRDQLIKCPPPHWSGVGARC